VDCSSLSTSSVESGDFDVIRRSLARLTGDRRIQILLVAFCFGALIEGIAGFGAQQRQPACDLVVGQRAGRERRRVARRLTRSGSRPSWQGAR